MKARTRIRFPLKRGGTAAWLSLLALVAVSPPSVASAGVLDQSQTAWDAVANFGAPDGGAFAQTFTAGLTGTLDRVDLVLSKDCPTGTEVRIYIEATKSDGSPAGLSAPTADSGPIPDWRIPTSPAFVSVPFTSPLGVTAGTKYAIVAVGDSTAYCTGGIPTYGWGHAATSDPYPAGNTWSFPPEGGGFEWVGPAPEGDFAFRTYVTITSTSSPPGTGTIGPGEPPIEVPAFGAATLVTLKLAAKRIPARGPLKVRVSNGNGFLVTGKLSGQTTRKVSISRKRRIRLRAKSFTVGAQAKKVVKLRLPRVLRRLLKRTGELSIRLTAKVRDPAGHTRTLRKTVKPSLK